MQLGAAKNTATTEDEYLAVIRAKTAELFAAACEVGPALAARPKDEQAACRSFGMNLGIAFQLVDDALDYGGKAAKLGKNVGDDFREGKITLPVVLSFRRGSESERAFWRRTLEEGDATDADLEHAIGLMTKHRALEDTIQRARHYGAIATRRAGAVSRLGDEAGAGRDGRVLHLPLELARPIEPRRRMRRARDLIQLRARRAHPPVRMPTAQRSRRGGGAADPNRPKQVAPEPDMRASRQSGSARSTASTSAITGCSSIAGASRSLRPWPAQRRTRWAPLPTLPIRARAGAEAPPLAGS